MSILWTPESLELAQGSFETTETLRLNGSVILTKTDGIKLELRVGTLLKSPMRPHGFIITEFSKKNDDPRGPIGLFYLPWRGTRFGSPIWSFRGNLRHLIASPVGQCHYGEHIDWDTVELLDTQTMLTIKAHEATQELDKLKFY